MRSLQRLVLRRRAGRLIILAQRGPGLERQVLEAAGLARRPLGRVNTGKP